MNQTIPPKYAYIMIALTTLYLVVELSFNASLLDVTGQTRSLEEIENIEIYGRCISSIAVILAIFGVFLRKCFLGQISLAGLIKRSIATVIIVFPLVFIGQKNLIEFLGVKSSGEERKNALWMSFISESLLGGDIELDGVVFQTGDESNADDKAFISLLPLWGSTIVDITSKAEPVMPHIVQKNVEKRIGSPENFYNGGYLPSLKNLHTLYNDKYVEGSNAYTTAMATRSSEAAKQWNKYTTTLKAKGYTPSNVPWRATSTVRREVQNSGVPVSRDWKPNDRTGFYNAIYKKISDSATYQFNSQTRVFIYSSHELKPGLSWSAFIASPAIQDTWKRQLNMPSSVRLGDRMTFEQFTRLAYKPMVASESKNILDTLGQSPEMFINDSYYASIGEDAYRSIIVAPIALGFSMLGGIIHIVKLLNFVLILLIGVPRIRRGIVLTTFGCLLYFPFTISHDITESRLITNLIEQDSTTLPSYIRSKTMVWIVKAQTHSYPLNDMLRRVCLRGYDFKH